MRQTLEDLRQRPKDERNAIAAWIAFGVVVILLAIWLVYFLHKISSTNVQPAATVQAATSSSDQNGLTQSSQQFQQATGTSTQFIETQNGTQLQIIQSTTSYGSQ